MCSLPSVQKILTCFNRCFNDLILTSMQKKYIIKRKCTKQHFMDFRYATIYLFHYLDDKTLLSELFQATFQPIVPIDYYIAPVFAESNYPKAL